MKTASKQKPFPLFSRFRMLTAGLALFALIVATGSIFSYYSFHTLLDSTRAIYHCQAELHELYKLHEDINNAVTASRAFRVTQNPAFLQEFQNANDKVNLHLKTLQGLVAGEPYSLARLRKLQASLKVRMEHLHESTEQARFHPLPHSQEIERVAEGKKLMEVVDFDLNELEKTEVSLLSQHQAEKTEQVLLSQGLLVLVRVGGLLVILFSISAALREFRKRRQTEEKLRVANDELEDRVKTRTKELENAFEALRTSDARFKLLWNNSADGIRLTDSDGVVVMANPAYCRMLGRPPEAVQGQPMSHVYLEAHREKIEKDHRASFDTRSIPARAEQSVILWNGDLMWLEVSYSFVEDAHAGPLLLAIFRDNTERRLADKNLRESEERYRLLFELESDAILLVDTENHHLLEANQSVQRLYGYSREELLTMRAEDLSAEPEKTRKAAGQGNYFVPLRWHRKKNGQHFAVEISATLIQLKDRRVEMAVIRDITARQHAEVQIHLQLAALTSAEIGIMITDYSGTITWVNPAFNTMTGYSSEELVGKNPRILKSGRTPATFYSDLWATICGGSIWRGEIVNRRKDGTYYTEDMTITPVSDTDGKITHFVAIKQDVTERRLMEKRIQQTQKLEAIGTLAGGIAHDFNNILVAMYGYTNLLQQDTFGNAAAQDSIAELTKATNRARDLVRQILTFSRQREQKHQTIRLDVVVKEAVKFLRASMPSLINIELKLEPNAPAVRADSTQIYQVVLNLATNALHAMEGQAGKLIVTLDSFTPHPAFQAQHPEFCLPCYAQLTIADTGHGMDENTLERIFEPFFTTKPVGKGTGLGLSVVHGIMESHNGFIRVESTAGRGTTFRLYFPGQMPDDIPLESGGSSAISGRGQRILLVDDDIAVTRPLHQLLSRLNYQVNVFNSAREAIRWGCENPLQFDLAITDMTMPEFSGVEVARQLHNVRPDLPIILFSGYNAELNREKVQAAGISEILEKPISQRELSRVLDRIFTEKAAKGVT